MINKYEFSKGTLAIVPNDEHSSLVLEDKDRYIVQNKPFQIMEDSCSYFGSSFEGRKEGAKSILGAEYKVPIVVQDSSNIIAFPTTSPYAADCCWISLRRVSNIYKVDNFNTKILFDNNEEIIVPCSFRSVENQLSRASRLDLVLQNRKNS
jgi:competence protein ComK